MIGEVSVSFPEVRAALCRMALGVTGIAGPREIQELARWLGACLTLENEAGVPPMYQPRRDGGARIVVPVLQDEWQEALFLLEEVGHFLCRAGLLLPPINPARATPGEMTLDELRELDEEHEARRFSDAFRLPPDLILRLGHDWEVWDVMEVAHADRETMDRRCRQVADLPRPLRFNPEAWSAWQRYRVRFQPHNRYPQILVAPVEEGPAFSWPLSEHQFSAALRQVHLDLAALRPEELALKYRDERLGPCREVALSWKELEESPELVRHRRAPV